MTVATDSASLVYTRSAWGHGRKWHVAEQGDTVSLCGVVVYEESNTYYPDTRSGVCARCAHSTDKRIDLR